MIRSLINRRGFVVSALAAAARRPLRIRAIADRQYADQDDNGQRMYRRAPACN